MILSFFFRSKFSLSKKHADRAAPLFFLVGLGNPGPEYAYTRHNVGFRVVDELALRCQTRLKKIKYQASFTRTILAERDLLLVKPLTFMNRSGVAVASLMRYYAVLPEHLLVIHDDLDLAVGRIRLRPTGGSGGHRGVSSIIEQLGSDQFPRLRIGIGRNPDEHLPGKKEKQVISHVLSVFQPQEEFLIQEVVKAAADAAEVFVLNGIGEAMNRFNAYGSS